MSLSDKFRTELQHLQRSSEHRVALREAPRKLICHFERTDVLACEVLRLALETDELANADMERLGDISEQLSRRVNYLLEPIGPIERDPEQCTVQMRSKPPQQDDGGTSYYELLVSRGGSLALCRYRKERGDTRKTIGSTLTREVLCRLVDDFQAVL